ncbi:MAG: NADP-dependent oxidoreductase [Actinobacteria bacterium]|nr:MAG: NADP-dependent oxidoreductase [Actinomycetota bacterium]
MPRQVRLRRHPVGALAADDFHVVDVPMPEPRDGEVLVRNTWTSVDPAIRIRLAAVAPAGYFPAFGLDAPMDGIMAVGEVVESLAVGFESGDTVWHTYGWRDYAAVPAGAGALGALGSLRRLDTAVAPAHAYLGPLGPMGLTAYAGLFDVAELCAGDVVWVSAAAGAVGSLAAQFAKLRGHTVIGSAGSDDKVAFVLGELGLDAAFNYKRGAIEDQLRAAAPDGIDVYFDNVGGDHLRAALSVLRRWGRVAICGAVSQYERDRPAPGPDNLFQAVANDLTLRGFRGSSYTDRMDDMQRDVAAWLRAGVLRHRETVVEGLEQAPEALVRMLAGGTIGKTLVHIA